MLCRRGTHAIPARSTNPGVRSDTTETPFAVEEASGPSQIELSGVNRTGQSSVEHDQHSANVAAAASQPWIRFVLAQKTLRPKPPIASWKRRRTAGTPS